MTLPRELRIRDGRLIQTPIAGIEALREAELAPEGRLLPACELEVEVPEGDFDLNLFTRADGSGGVAMHYDADRRVCTFDRRGMEKRFNEAVGEVLELPLDETLRTMRIFIDRSSCEYFVNGGEATFTTHCYPTEAEFGYTISDGAKMRIWRLGRSVGDEFVI